MLSLKKKMKRLKKINDNESLNNHLNKLYQILIKNEIKSCLFFDEIFNFLR